MTIYSLFIFDRHCQCIYYQDWHRTRPPRPGSTTLPHVSPAVSPSPSPSPSSFPTPTPTQQRPTSQTTTTTDRTPWTPTLPSQSQSARSSLAPRTDSFMSGGTGGGALGAGGEGAPPAAAQPAGLPFDEEAKLVYGVVFSLKNMVKKISGRDDSFLSLRTSSYKLHFYETPTSYRFVMLSDARADSLRFVLRQIHSGPFLEHVVRNPLVDVLDSKERGIDSEAFRGAVDALVRGLSVFN